MHWPTDVAASVVFTPVWLFLLRAILLPPGVADRRS
jgi:membrane-associated phospholipid phosphatase